jgi:glycosyltransferase 2 family protein
LPFTPAGLGVVEAAIIVVLKLVNVDPAMAGSIAVIDRVIGYWSLILVGTILYIWRLKTELRVATKPATT